MAGPKRPSPAWLIEIIHYGLQRHGGNMRKYAEAIGVRPQSVMAWLGQVGDGHTSIPSALNLARILELIGGQVFVPKQPLVEDADKASGIVSSRPIKNAAELAAENQIPYGTMVPLLPHNTSPVHWPQGSTAPTPQAKSKIQASLDAALAEDRRKRPAIRISTPILGSVSAGLLIWDESQLPADERPSLEVDPETFRNSAYWRHTQGPLTLLRVQGDSMSPQYPNGSVIAVRPPRDPFKLPDRTPCIFQTDQGQTFKLLRRSPDRRVVAQPLNDQHPILTFDPEEPLAIPFVVLGVVSFT